MQTFQAVGAVLHGQAHCAVGSVAQGHYRIFGHGASFFLAAGGCQGLEQHLLLGNCPYGPQRGGRGHELGGAKFFLSQVLRPETEFLNSLIN